MPTADELTEAIVAAEMQKARCARLANGLVERCQLLRADDPRHPDIPGLSEQIEALDKLHDRISDDIGKMRDKLGKIEGARALDYICNRFNLSEY